jgi:hypothetical protein
LIDRPSSLIDGLEGVRGNAQLDGTPERIGNQGDIEQVGQESPFGLDVGVTYLVADLRGLAGQIASSRHWKTSNISGVRAHHPAPPALQHLGFSQAGGPIVSEEKGVKQRLRAAFSRSGEDESACGST